MPPVRTVGIVNPDNPEESILINESDYNGEEQTLWDEREQSVGPPADDDPDPAVVALLEGTIPDLEARLAETSDVELLKEAKAAEEVGENRVGAVDAIEERIGELES